MKKIKRLLLVDDNEDDNFIHSRILFSTGLVEEISLAYDGREALDLLTRPEEGKPGNQKPQIIFLDINMPRMDGWEFLEAYGKLPVEQKGEIMVVMLTNSDNPDDRRRAEKYTQIHKFSNKPLTAARFEMIVKEFFPEVVNARQNP